jgi:isopropylmalate/homocitrate/citramalate synthase
MTISILDCTLRDGGYVNNWNFPQKQTTKIIKSLNKSNVDIVELGYLDDKNGKPNNSTLFNSVESVSDLIDGINLSFDKVVMINLFDFDVNELPQQSKTQIDGIRLAFHKKDIQEALVQAQKVIDLGYQLFFQPMVTKSYSDEDFLSAIKQANQLKIYAFYIVDSFGSMSLKEFKRYSNLANDNLREDICLGYHSHNNMQLAFSNAIDLCSMDFDREVIVDSSIYGMGRGAGNLNTELIADYLNTQDKKYNVIPLLEIIDELLTYYFKRHPWGFSPAQYLSASLDCHPNYASYLVNKKTNHIADIRNILEKISPDCKNDFDKKYCGCFIPRISIN